MNIADPACGDYFAGVSPVSLHRYLVTPSLPAAAVIPLSEPKLPKFYHDLFADGFARIAQCWSDLKQQCSAFEQLYSAVEASSEPPAAIRALAQELETHERRLAAEYIPGWQQIAARLPYLYQRKKRDQNAKSMVRMAEETIEVGAAWLESFQNIRLRLIRLASDRDGEPSPVFSDPDAAMEHLRSALVG
jgi:hypothetical protein